METNHAKLIYHLKDVKKEEKILRLCKQLGITTRKIKRSDENVSLGTLAGIFVGTAMQPTRKAPKDYEMPELFIFTGMEERKLDEFLAEYRKQGIEPVSLKAIVTQHNICWSVYQLTAELIKERTAILMRQPPH